MRVLTKTDLIACKQNNESVIALSAGQVGAAPCTTFGIAGSEVDKLLDKHQKRIRKAARLDRILFLFLKEQFTQISSIGGFAFFYFLIQLMIGGKIDSILSFLAPLVVISLVATMTIKYVTDITMIEQGDRSTWRDKEAEASLLVRALVGVVLAELSREQFNKVDAEANDTFRNHGHAMPYAGLSLLIDVKSPKFWKKIPGVSASKTISFKYWLANRLRCSSKLEQLDHASQFRG